MKVSIKQSRLSKISIFVESKRWSTFSSQLSAFQILYSKASVTGTVGDNWTSNHSSASGVDWVWIPPSQIPLIPVRGSEEPLDTDATVDERRMLVPVESKIWNCRKWRIESDTEMRARAMSMPQFEFSAENDAKNRRKTIPLYQ